MTVMQDCKQAWHMTGELLLSRQNVSHALPCRVFGACTSSRERACWYGKVLWRDFISQVKRWQHCSDAAVLLKLKEALDLPLLLLLQGTVFLSLLPSLCGSGTLCSTSGDSATERKALHSRAMTAASGWPSQLHREKKKQSSAGSDAPISTNLQNVDFQTWRSQCSGKQPYWQAFAHHAFEQRGKS